MVLASLLFFLLPTFAPPLYLGMIVRVGSAALAVKVVNEHLLFLVFGLDNLDLGLLLFQAGWSSWFPRGGGMMMMSLWRVGLMWGAGVAEA